MGETKNLYRVLLCKSERQKPFDRPTSKWENDIKMSANEEGLGRGLDSSSSREETRQNSCEYDNRSSGFPLIISTIILPLQLDPH
jgi:hypothetical protein